LAGLLFRTVQLFFLYDVQTGLVWMTKILTDPFHDIKLYYKAPLYLMRVELIDPNHGRKHGLRLSAHSRFRGNERRNQALSFPKRCLRISRRMLRRTEP